LKRILATVGAHTYVTKVSARLAKLNCGLAICLAMFPWTPACGAQTASPQTHKSGPAESLYLQLSSIGLDSTRVFRVRDSSLDRPAIHITLEDGTIAFTRDVLGKITGAFFEGDGEVLLVPPNDVERRSMSLFTGMAILEERFSTAYFRFNDDTAAELQPGLRAPEDAPGFIARWDETTRNLAQVDAMRLMASFSGMLPAADGMASKNAPLAGMRDQSDHMLHARIQGNTLGVFDILYDSTAGEQVEAGQAKAAENGTVSYDVWTSFSAGAVSSAHSALAQTLQTLPTETDSPEDRILVRSYIIDAQVKPPKELDAEVTLNLEVKGDRSRFLVFELSRFLKIQTVEEDGHAVEFIQNPAVEGTRLARSGNDLVAVILSQPAQRGQKTSLRFVYGGEVLAEAGKGLLYVGARGTWYPNRGMAMSDFDLTFHYPSGWTLVATGKPTPVAKAADTPAQISSQSAAGAQVGRWVSERPIPVAGFNLGKYVRASAQAGNVRVETYATIGVERDFPAPLQIEPAPEPSRNKPLAPLPSPLSVSPARNATALADSTARAIRYYSELFGPFPYSNLALTQLPGRESQGWPGLIFLSSYAFLSPEERQEIRMNPSEQLTDQQIPAHEAAHQWWGDLVTWSTYRDQWFSEGLANYCSLMILRGRNPAGFRQIMEKYRQDLVAKNKEGNLPKDAGPVTLGSRLFSSHFPESYQAISYGRGTWLFHMLHSMLQDAAAESQPAGAGRTAAPDPFVRALRKLRDRYEGKSISTRQLLEVFAEDLPPSLRYEGKASLDWYLEGWVNGTSLPRLELHSVKFSQKTNGVVATGVIRQTDSPETLVTSVPIYAAVSAGPPLLLGRVFADGPETSFHLSAPAGTRKLLLDPNETILTGPKK
jgi:hypothetical protein